MGLGLRHGQFPLFSHWMQSSGESMPQGKAPPSSGGSTASNWEIKSSSTERRSGWHITLSTGYTGMLSATPWEILNQLACPRERHLG